MLTLVTSNEFHCDHAFENIVVECLPLAYKIDPNTPDDMAVMLLKIEPLEEAA